MYIKAFPHPELLPTTQSVLQGISGDVLQRPASEILNSNFIKEKAGLLAFCRLMFFWRMYLQSNDTHPSTTHMWMRKLRHQDKLLCCFTQNIDGLEGLAQSHCPDPEGAGGSIEDVVRIHGDLFYLRCTYCGDSQEWKDEHSSSLIFEGSATCSSCEADRKSRWQAGKRYNSGGRLRPRVVMYGDTGDGTEAGAAVETALTSRPQLFFVMGTSLHGSGARGLVTRMATQVHEEPGGLVVFVSHEKPKHPNWKNTTDYHVEMSCDEFVLDLQTRVDRLNTELVSLPGSEYYIETNHP